MSGQLVKKPDQASQQEDERFDWGTFPLQQDKWLAIEATLGLSPQLTRVVRLVLRDFSNKEICQALNLSEGTVKDYLRRIGQQTGTSSRTQLLIHIIAIFQDVLRQQQNL